VKLLLDHNISHKLVARLADIFPDSTQTRLLNFGRTIKFAENPGRIVLELFD